MTAKVIAGFPGVGKSYFFNSVKGNRVLDSDSSTFSKDPDFPQNYINHIQRMIESDTVDLIFVSTHKVVRDALTAAGIDYTAIIPPASGEALTVYTQRYKDRGSSDEFIKLISDNWYNWLVDISQTAPTVYTLKPDGHLSDVIHADLEALIKSSQDVPTGEFTLRKNHMFIPSADAVIPSSEKKIYTKEEIWQLKEQYEEAKASVPVYCRRCKTDLPRIPRIRNLDDALIVTLDGGYGMYVDESPWSFPICKQCATELCAFLNIDPRKWKDYDN